MCNHLIEIKILQLILFYIKKELGFLWQVVQNFPESFLFKKHNTNRGILLNSQRSQLKVYLLIRLLQFGYH